ncbi:MAG: hypothetical protein J7518_09785 [Nocardioidaceae bacterium]|nr:hypothetical protein [Nocardioidaceae bacterium]
MSGPPKPEDSVPAPPPEVPEEYAAAYAEAYRRALESGQVGQLEPQEIVTVGAHSSHGEHPARLLDQVRASRWGLPLLLTGLALLLVLGAYGVGKLASDDGGPDVTGTSGTTEGTGSPSRGTDRPSSKPTKTERARPVAGAWDGPVQPIRAAEATADCVSRPSVDSAGERVTYGVGKTLDDDAATAWRCDGPATGEKLTFAFDDDVELAEVGLIPGYAKTDAKSGADRYVENNRITRVRWTFGDGESVVQKFDPDPENRAVQTVRVPRTETDEVTLEILEVRRGPRNTTAISEVVFAEVG